MDFSIILSEEFTKKILQFLIQNNNENIASFIDCKLEKKKFFCQNVQNELSK